MSFLYYNVKSFTMTDENANETQTLRNWTNEAKEADEISNKNWFKPADGVEYIVTFLDEGGSENVRQFEDRSITQIDFRIKSVDEQNQTQEQIWTVTKGGKDSCFGKLVHIFAEKGKATDTIVLVTAVGEGKNRRYLVKTPRAGGLQ